MDSKSIECQDYNDKTADNDGSTNIVIKCRGEVSTESQVMEAGTISDGSGETIHTGLVEQSVESDVRAMTTSVMDITVTGLNSSSAVHLIALYHMMGCIQMKVVENPPLWPYAHEYKTCRSPIINPESKVMEYSHTVRWLNYHKNVQLMVTESFLRDIVWCAQYEFKFEQIMFFSFHNLMKHCTRTEDVANKYDFLGGGPDEPPIFLVKVVTVALYHIFWCVQNETLSFKGLPMSYEELLTCKSPMIPFNKEAIQGTSLEWWSSSNSLGKIFRMSISIFIDLIKCARRKIFKPRDMIHPDSMISACTKISNRSIEIVSSKEVRDAHKARKTQESMLKPIYICLGVIILLFGGLGNLLTCVIALRKKMRKTSSGLYLSSLAIIDTLFLYIRIITQILAFLIGNFEIVSTFTCKMYPFFVHYVDYLSAWLRLCFTIERTVAVTLPYVYHVYFSRRISLIISLACSLILAATMSPMIFFFASNGEHCIYQTKWKNVLSWSDVVLSTILPFTGIIVSNSIMMYSLCKARRNRQQLTDNQAGIHKITIMCITTSLFFVLSTTPIRVYTMFKNYSLYDDHRKSTIDMRFDVRLLLDSCRVINSAVNFLLYYVSGSVFRQELLKLFKGTN